MAAFDSAIEIPAIPNTGKALADAMSKAQNLKLDKPEAVPMSPMDSMKLMFADMRDSLQQIAENTFKTTELLLGGTPKQQRDKGIKEGDVDAGPPPEKKGPGIFARMKGTLANLNPFKGGMSPLATFLLTGAALLGLKMFGEKAVGPLADFVKSIKEGTLIKKMKDIVESIKKDLEPWWKRIKENIVKFIAGTKIVFGLIEDAYNFVNDYIKQFDTDDKPGLSKEEKKLLKEDLKDKAVGFITGFFKDVMLALGGAILGYTFISSTVKRIMASGTMTAILKGGVKPMSLKAGIAGMSTAGKMFSIAGLLLYGITTTWTNVADSYQKTLKENSGEFETKRFLANFFGGKDEGGLLSALKQAFLVGGTGTLVGMAVGLVGGPVGVIMGGLIGTAIGGLVGAITGYIGSDKIDKALSWVTDALKSAVDKIGSFFGRVIEGFKTLATEGDFGAGFNKKKLTRDIEDYKEKAEKYEQHGIDVDNMTLEEALAALEEEKGAILSKSKGLSKYDSKVKNLKALYKDKERLTTTADVGIGAEKLRLNKKIEERKNIAEMSDAEYRTKYPTKGGQRPGMSKAKTDVAAMKRNRLKALDEDINELSADIAEMESISSKAIIKSVVTKKETTFNTYPPGQSGILIAPSTTDRSVKVKTDNNYLGGLSSGDNFMTAVTLARKNAKMVD